MAIIHDFECEACGAMQPNTVCSSQNHDEDPECCGQKMFRVLGGLKIGVQVFESFTTRNIDPDGKPIRIASKGDLEWAAREYGVRRDYDDPDLEAVGTEIRKKTPKIGKVFDMGRR